MTRRYPARQRARTRSHNQQNTPASGHHSLKRWAICGAAVFAFVIALWWLLGDATTNFTAALTYDKPVVITYDGSYLDKKSPACGCAKAAPDEWRGISFISRRISIGPIQTRQS